MSYPVIKSVLSYSLILCLITFSFAIFANTSSTADHSTFKELDGPFTSGPDVTRACLQCHTEAAKQVHTTKHWTWEFQNKTTGQLLGKRHVVNNFCISAEANIESCSSCHVGYGWKDDSFDFSSEAHVDCLVCHDQSGLYDKTKLRGGKVSNLSKIAKKVGATTRTNCGTCHFKGGGGKAVKHGDLDPSFDAPDIFVDVHMEADGLNFTCSTCHTTYAHQVTGSRYDSYGKDETGIDYPGKAGDNSRASCVSCHGESAHKSNTRLNDHTDKIACQTCHIPLFARGDYPSKMWWDWSTAGRLSEDGKPLSILDEWGNEIYNSKKGDFTWARDVIPEYVWFNGAVDYILPEDSFDPSKTVALNQLQGSAKDGKSLIWPVKVMRGKQPYDSINNRFVTPLTTTDDGYWHTFDWPSAIEKGMAITQHDFSGKYNFVETEMSWPIAHMVAPASEALSCEDCHSKNGRLASITDIYIPGRGTNDWLDKGGFALLLLSLFAVLMHALMRFVLNRKPGPRSPK